MRLRQNRNPRGEAGFTLIEIAIVLVIIGLLLGGVLQGQQLIENSRVRSATNDINGIAAGAFSYQERYGRLPGDDPGTSGTDGNTLEGRGDSWTGVTAGNGNGVLDGSATSMFDEASAGEMYYFFQHLRAAGFINGDPANDSFPQNPFGGLTSVTNETVNGNLAGLKVCMSNVSGSAAIALDTQLDDGDGSSGRFRATLATNPNDPPSTDAMSGSYNEDQIYTVCYRI